MTPLLDIKNLHLKYHRDGISKKALSDISFSLYPGEILGIVGESGSGKSLTAKSILSLLPPHFSVDDASCIEYLGKALPLHNQKQMRAYRGKEISMIFQDPMSCLNPTMKVGKQILEAFHTHYKNVSIQVAKEKILHLLDSIGIPDPSLRYHQYPHQLSGGMRQRIMIAICMVVNPKILIADEPTTALDATIQIQILQLLKDLQKNSNLSILFITHNLGLIANFCDRVIVMYNGKIVESADVLTLFKNPQHPYTQKLLRSIPQLHLPNLKELSYIEGSPPPLLEDRIGCSFAPRCIVKKPECMLLAPPVVQISKNHRCHCILPQKIKSEELTYDKASS